MLGVGCYPAWDHLPPHFQEARLMPSPGSGIRGENTARNNPLNLYHPLPSQISLTHRRPEWDPEPA